MNGSSYVQVVTPDYSSLHIQLLTEHRRQSHNMSTFWENPAAGMRGHGCSAQSCFYGT